LGLGRITRQGYQGQNGAESRFFLHV